MSTPRRPSAPRERTRDYDSAPGISASSYDKAGFILLLDAWLTEHDDGTPDEQAACAIAREIVVATIAGTDRIELHAVDPGAFTVLQAALADIAGTAQLTGEPHSEQAAL